MKRQRFSGALIVASMGAVALTSAGCSSLGGSATEIGLAGVGGALGYEVSDHKVGGAAAGAAAGYIAGKVARREVNRREEEAEKRGYDRAMNQAVKQQYWIIQQQQQRAGKAEAKTATLVPVVIPETNVNGIIRKESVAYVPTGP